MSAASRGCCRCRYLLHLITSFEPIIPGKPPGMTGLLSCYPTSSSAVKICCFSAVSNNQQAVYFFVCGTCATETRLLVCTRRPPQEQLHYRQTVPVFLLRAQFLFGTPREAAPRVLCRVSCKNAAADIVRAKSIMQPVWRTHRYIHFFPHRSHQPETLVIDYA